MAIKISGNAFQGISSLGSSVPTPGFYPVSIVDIETGANDKPGTRRFHVQFENGFKMFTFLSLPYDNDGNALPGLTDKQVRGRMAALRTVLESLGYTKENIETASEINDSWFLSAQNNGRLAYVEFVPGQRGVSGSYNEVKKFMTKAQYEAMKSADKDTTEASPAPTPAAKVQATATNGAPVPPAGVALPPPASAAQGIVS
tara:strand:+ start:10068 stop:10670 length:603 start_codon:yes stop_codon:yes gene_type:complete